MILLLSGLEFLALIDLLYLEFLLLLLVFLVLSSVACVWSGDMFGRRQIPSVNRGARASGFCCGWEGSFGVRASIVVRGRSRSGVNCSTFSGGYRAAVFEGAGPGCSSNGRLAAIGGGA